VGTSELEPIDGWMRLSLSLSLSLAGSLSAFLFHIIGRAYSVWQGGEPLFTGKQTYLRAHQPLFPVLIQTGQVENTEKI